MKAEKLSRAFLAAAGEEPATPKRRRSSPEPVTQSEDLPRVLFCLDRTGSISFKLPRKGAKWQGKYRDIGEAVSKASKELGVSHFLIIYVHPNEKQSD